MPRRSHHKMGPVCPGKRRSPGSLLPLPPGRCSHLWRPGSRLPGRGSLSALIQTQPPELALCILCDLTHTVNMFHPSLDKFHGCRSFSFLFFSPVLLIPFLCRLCLTDKKDSLLHTETDLHPREFHAVDPPGIFLIPGLGSRARTSRSSSSFPSGRIRLISSGITTSRVSSFTCPANLPGPPHGCPRKGGRA